MLVREGNNGHQPQELTLTQHRGIQVTPGATSKHQPGPLGLGVAGTGVRKETPTNIRRTSSNLRTQKNNLAGQK